MVSSVALVAVQVVAFADGELKLHGVLNLAEHCKITASCSAGPNGAKYGIDSAIDGDLNTWWASCDRPQYPVTIRLTLAQPTSLDTLAFVQAENPSIYTNWKRVRVEFSDGTTVEEELKDSAAPVLIRFARRTVAWVEVSIVEAHDPAQHYVTLREIMLLDDPERKVTIKMPPTERWKNPDLTPLGRPEHPCVYATREDVERAKRRIATEPWARRWFESAKASADEWAGKEDAWIASLIPPKGACFAYGFTGCPICGASWGTWGAARCTFENPGHVTCANGHVLPDAEHPDPGTGYVGPDGRTHYFVGSYNAWLVETLQFKALQPLAYVYALTGDEKYAAKAAYILDLLADIYPSCDKGSWDYPSNPPSGRFCRPWYQVARVLIHYTDWYDLLYHSSALDQLSVRPGLTRRANIETNLLQNGARYCYDQSLHGRLHNGEADYIRGALAVGCCLGIPWYIDWAYDGPYGILNMIRNNADRDGQYFETSTMYADHTRELYLTFAEPLLNYRSTKYPGGINLYDDPQFQSFLVLPQLSFNCLGKSPRFGDSAPDTTRSFLPGVLTSVFDYRLAERLYARVSNQQDKRRFGALLSALCDGDVTRMRDSNAEVPWLLFHGAEPPTEEVRYYEPLWDRRIHRCEFFGQKGIGILRTGKGATAQAALVRFGPTLNHGHLDDLNLNYYALGYELTYDLGYGLGSTHTQVGWAYQTASHNLVLVDETPQGSDGSGTGGSLHLFADLPGLKIMEASAENSYVRQGVSVYRRLVAMVGDGPETYLVDMFRVAGGKQHDYLFHSFGTEVQFSQVELGAPDAGSLAGPEIRWGELQLNDGDMLGHPGKPYWNPPPGNGLGFLMAPQRGRTDDTWTATWPVPEGDGAVRLTMLGQPGTEVITAWAPGILPTYPKARYAIARRKGGNLASIFVAIIEPYSPRLAGVQVDADEIAAKGHVTAGETKYVAEHQVFLYKGTGPGDELRWPLRVDTEGDYLVAVDHYHSHSYGQAQILIDGQPVGAPLVGTANEVRAAPLATLGVVHLAAGDHLAAVRMVADDGAGHYWFGIRSLWLLPGGTNVSTEPQPFVRRAERLVCTPQDSEIEAAGLLVMLDDAGNRYDAILSATDGGHERRFASEARAFRLQGAFAHARIEGELPSEAHLVATRRFAFGHFEFICGEAAYQGTVRSVDLNRAVFETTTRLPTDGRLAGQPILFSSERYSRNTAYRIASVESLPDGSRLTLEAPSFVLGTGIVEDDPSSAHEFVSLLPHEYARSDSVPGTQFFSGKLIRGERFATRIIRTQFGQFMRCEVERTNGMRAGDVFAIVDVQAGDRFSIPTVAYLQRKQDGSFGGYATTDVTVVRGGQPIARVVPSS